MMDLNLSQTASVIFVDRNGQSFFIQNNPNTLNSEPCNEVNSLNNSLPAGIADSFALNLNCTGVDSFNKVNNTAMNHQIIAIVDENQSQTFEITSEQAAQLGLHLEGNDQNKTKLSSCDDILNELPENESTDVCVTSSCKLVNSNLALSVSPTASSAVPNLNDSLNDVFNHKLCDTEKKILLQSSVNLSEASQLSNPSKLPVSLQYNLKLGKQFLQASLESQYSCKLTKSARSSSFKSQTSAPEIISTEAITAGTKLPSPHRKLKFAKKKNLMFKNSRLTSTADFECNTRENFSDLLMDPANFSIRSSSSNVSVSPSETENMPNSSGSDNQRNSLNTDMRCVPESEMVSLNDEPTNKESNSSGSISRSKSAFQMEEKTHARKSSSEDERLDVTVNAQSLTKEQLKQIAQVFSKQRFKLDTNAPSKNVVYDPETNTRIICRVVYPEDLCKDKSGSSINSTLDGKDVELNKCPLKKRGRRPKSKVSRESKTVEESERAKQENKEDSIAENFDEETTLNNVSRTTRSGRISRPPRHMMKGSGRDDPPQEKSSFFFPLSELFTKKRLHSSTEYKCPTCHKLYLGRSRMAKHFENWPTHGNIQEWLNKLKPSLKDKEMENADRTSNDNESKKLYSGKKRRKKTRSYEQHKIDLKQALEDCSKADVAALAGPIVASVLSVWEFLVLRSAKVKLDNENHVLALLRELKLFLNHIKSSAEAFISPVTKTMFDSEAKNSNEIEIKDDATSHVLGMPFGRYCVNNNYENTWLKSFSERNAALTENDSFSIKRSKNETENLNFWSNEEPFHSSAEVSKTVGCIEKDRVLNTADLLSTGNDSSSPSNLIAAVDKIPDELANVDKIVSERIENFRVHQQNELNECFSSVDDLINNLSSGINSMDKNSSRNDVSSLINDFGSANVDKPDSNCNLDLNFVNFQRSTDIINDLSAISSLNDEQSSINKNLDFVKSTKACSSTNGCSASSLLSSSVNYVDSSLYDNMASNLAFSNSDVISNVSSSTEDLMKSFVTFELRSNNSNTSLGFDPINQFSSVVLHDDTTVSPAIVSQVHAAESYIVDNSAFKSAVEQISNLVASSNSEESIVKQNPPVELDFVHSLNCLDPPI